MISNAIYKRAVSSFIFPVHEIMKGHTTSRAKKQLEKSQWWSREEIAAYQLQELNRLLDHARSTTKYYAEIFAECGLPRKLESISQLRSIPFLTKSIITKNTDQLKSSTGTAALTKLTTSGSTGAPLVFYLGQERISHDVAAKWRATRWWGVDIGSPEIVVWGSPIELSGQGFTRDVRDLLLNTRLLDAFDLSEDNIKQCISTIKQQAPDMIFGYPSTMDLIALYAESHNIDFRDAAIKVLFVTAEMMHDEQRKRMERIFGCRVANGYGGRDAGFIAHECPFGSMHITAEDMVVETVDADGEPVDEGEIGEVVVTHLRSSGFPFIRYKTGDLATLSGEACGCGRGLPVLEKVHGRAVDFLVNTSGDIVNSASVLYAIRKLDSVAQFQIHQHSKEHVEVFLVPYSDASDMNFDPIEKSIHKNLGDTIKIKTSIVDRIPRTKSGKHRYVISDVAKEHIERLARS